MRLIPGLRVALLLLGTSALPGLAATARLDDSTSPRSQVSAPQVLSETGQPFSPLMSGPPPRGAIVRFGRVDYRLATSAWLGRAARIYYVLPSDVPGLRSPAGLVVEWRGNGVFGPGRARPGERVLVWSGIVREAFMSEGLDLSWRLDLRELQLRSGQALGFESFFEIETPP